MAQLFDGTGDYIACPDHASYDFGTGDFAFCFWGFSAATTTQDVFNRNRATATATTAGYGFTISSAAGTGVSAHLGDGTNYARIDTGTDSWRGGSVWYHMVINFDRAGTTVYIYENNSLKNSGSCAAVTGTVDSAVQICVASNSTPGRYFNGRISDFCIVNRVITASERALLYNSKVKRLPLELFTTNLIGYYPCDYTPDGSTVSTGAGAMLDLSSTGNHGTAYGNGTGVAETFLTYP